MVDVHRTWRGQPVSFGTAILDQLTGLVITTLAAALVIRLTRVRPQLVRLLLLLGTARVPLLLVAGVVLASPTPAEILAPGSSALVAPPPSAACSPWLHSLASCGSARAGCARRVVRAAGDSPASPRPR